jgi:hypothetical protein
MYESKKGEREILHYSILIHGICVKFNVSIWLEPYIQ